MAEAVIYVSERGRQEGLPCRKDKMILYYNIKKKNLYTFSQESTFMGHKTILHKRM
ncbi:MAG: hypothetical protein ACOX05_06225 [Bacillota bacterium]|jgi:hypothetical protein